MAFALPKDGAIYAKSVFSRCQDLISHDVWSGIDPHRLGAWIENFKTNEERYLAACILDSLIYRSTKQTVALMQQLFQRIVPDASRLHGLDPSLRRIYTLMRTESIDPLIRIVPVIPFGASPTKSGPIIARMLRRELRFSDNWIIYPDQVVPLIGQIPTFIFIDDFLGTGLQFSEFLSDSGLNAYLDKACFIYAPLCAHANGVAELRSFAPKLTIEQVELLDDTHAVFHEQAGFFPDEINSCEATRDFYYELLDDRRIEIDGPDRRGFGHFELAYAFQHAIPDNSLPILWWSMSTQWRPLLDR